MCLEGEPGKGKSDDEVLDIPGDNSATDVAKAISVAVSHREVVGYR